MATHREKVVEIRFRELLAGTPGSRRNLFSTNLAALTIESIASFEISVGLRLNAEQRAAVEMAVHQPFSVLTGGAGTGKTTVLQVIHRIAEQVGIPVVQMALSGRAAQRIRDATQRPASTIAAFLRMAEQGSIDPESEPLVIIDESSMLDLPLTYSIGLCQLTLASCWLATHTNCRRSASAWCSRNSPPA